MQALSLVTTANIASWVGAVIALGLGIFSLVISVKANRRSARIEARDTETHDVEWRGRWADLTIYELRNAGSTPACKVEAVLLVDGKRFTMSEPIVGPDESIRFSVPGNALRLEAEKREHAAAGPIGDLYGSPRIYVETEVRVTWQSPRGAPHSFQDHQSEYLR